MINFFSTYTNYSLTPLYFSLLQLFFSYRHYLFPVLTIYCIPVCFLTSFLFNTAAYSLLLLFFPWPATYFLLSFFSTSRICSPPSPIFPNPTIHSTRFFTPCNLFPTTTSFSCPCHLFSVTPNFTCPHNLSHASSILPTPQRCFLPPLFFHILAINSLLLLFLLDFFVFLPASCFPAPAIYLL